MGAFIVVNLDCFSGHTKNNGIFDFSLSPQSPSILYAAPDPILER